MITLARIDEGQLSKFEQITFEQDSFKGSGNPLLNHSASITMQQPPQKQTLDVKQDSLEGSGNPPLNHSASVTMQQPLQKQILGVNRPTCFKKPTQQKCRGRGVLKPVARKFMVQETVVQMPVIAKMTPFMQRPVIQEPLGQLYILKDEIRAAVGPTIRDAWKAAMNSLQIAAEDRERPTHGMAKLLSLQPANSVRCSYQLQTHTCTAVQQNSYGKRPLKSDANRLEEDFKKRFCADEDRAHALRCEQQAALQDHLPVLGSLMEGTDPITL